jgi:hypothetical protein
MNSMGEPERPTGTHPAAWPVNGPAWIDPRYGETQRAAQRPLTIRIACLLTWITTGLVPYSYLMWLFGFFLMPDTFIPMLMRWLGMSYVNFTSSDRQWVYLLVHLLVFAWAVGVMVLTWMVWNRNLQAHRLLMISAAVALPVCLFTFPLSFFNLLACVAVLVLLWLGRSWFVVPGRRRTENAGRISIPFR